MLQVKKYENEKNMYPVTPYNTLLSEYTLIGFELTISKKGTESQRNNNVKYNLL